MKSSDLDKEVGTLDHLTVNEHLHAGPVICLPALFLFYSFDH